MLHNLQSNKHDNTVNSAVSINGKIEFTTVQIKQKNMHTKEQDVSISEEIYVNIDAIEHQLSTIQNKESVSEESFSEQKYDAIHSNQSNHTNNNNNKLSQISNTGNNGEKSPPTVPNTFGYDIQKISNQRSNRSFNKNCCLQICFKICFPSLVMIILGIVLWLIEHKIQSKLLGMLAVIIIMFVLILIPTISVYFIMDDKYVYKTGHWFIVYIYDVIVAVPTVLLICVMIFVIPGANAFRSDVFTPILITGMLFVVSALPFVYCVGCMICKSRPFIKSVLCGVLLLVGLIPFMFEIFGDVKLGKELKYIFKSLMCSYCAVETFLQYQIKEDFDHKFSNYFALNASGKNWLIIVCQLVLYFALLNMIHYFKINRASVQSNPKNGTALNWTSFYSFEYLTMPIKWCDNMFMLFDVYMQSDITNTRMIELFNEILIDSKSRISFLKLCSDYIRFKASGNDKKIIVNDGIQHPQKFEEFEKSAFDLYARRNSLSKNEKIEYKTLVQKLDENDKKRHNKIMHRANKLYLQIVEGDIDLTDLSREYTEVYVTNQYKDKYLYDHEQYKDFIVNLLSKKRAFAEDNCQLKIGLILVLFVVEDYNDDIEQKLEIVDYEIIQMIVSKIYIKQIDNKLLNEHSEKKQITFLIPMADEHHRLNRKYYRNCNGYNVTNFTGEDFLNVKLNQLDFIFKDTQMLDWSLVFVDDCPKRSTKEAILKHESLINGKFSHFKNKVIVLDYQNDLYKFISLYNNEQIAKESWDTFADNSYKGGAVHLGLRYVTHVLKDVQYAVKNADFIYVSDCDVSVNLATVGILLQPLINGDADIVIGSRRKKNSHVVGKPLLRQIQSQTFNLLVQFMLNVHVTDTQVGSKLFKANVIKNIHKDFEERSMSFDVEILKLALNNNYKIHEEGIIWIDSQIESKSAQQAGNMLQGLLNIWRSIYCGDHTSDTTINVHTKQDFIRNGLMLKKNELRLLESVLDLATNDKFNFILNHLLDAYRSITPKQFRIFMDSLQQFTFDLLTTNKDIDILKKEICELLVLFQQFIDTFQQTDIINFMFFEFPQMFNILELIYKNLNYVYVLSSIFLGDNFMSISKHFGFQSFYLYYTKQKNDNKVDQHIIEYYDQWLKDDSHSQNRKIKSKKQCLIFNETRFTMGKQKLQQMNNNLSQSKISIKIGIVMIYHLDSTSIEYVDLVLKSKLRMLFEEYGNLKCIKFVFYIIDARLKSENITLTNYIDKVLSEFNDNTQHNVFGTQLQLFDHELFDITKEYNFIKPTAVRFGLKYAADDKCDYVGFIDFSNKIDIREISNFIYNLHEHQVNNNDKHVMVIGSRRLNESQVVNKPIPYLFRSAMLNILVKAIFPNLFKLSDTQTGFKFFTSTAWKKIIQYHLHCDSIVFDVEILQCALNSDIQINELPVDFEDNSQNMNEIQSSIVNNQVIELIALRGRMKDNQEKNSPVFIGSGAENVVYSIPNSNNNIIKIPINVFNIDFCGFLKYVMFKHRKEMNLMDQNSKITSSSSFQQILHNPIIKQFIPDLRKWKQLNLFVMQLITAFENKNYKSIGYHIASKLGKDLVVPFKIIDYKFSLTFEHNQRKYFEPKNKVIQSVLVSDTFNKTFEDILISDKRVKHRLKALIKQGVDLFYESYHRGFFDLDTNLMQDTGFYDTGFYDSKLMMLDPGELIDDISTIDIHIERNKVCQRYDILEMEALLKQYLKSDDDTNDILNYYKHIINGFLDFIEKDQHPLANASQIDEQKCKYSAEKPNTSTNTSNISQKNISQFGKDQLDANKNQFAIIFNDEHKFDVVESSIGEQYLREMENKKAAYLYSSVEYQSLFIYPKTNTSDNLFLQPRNDHYFYYHLIPSDVVIEDEAIFSTSHYLPHKKINVEIGSIGPMLSDETLQRMNDTFTFDEHDKTLIIISDAGSATRSGIMKFGGKNNSLCTKGNIHIFNHPIYDYAARSFVDLIENSKNILQHGYTIIAAGDEVVKFDDKQINDIIQYFSGDNSPGLYWCDLPNAAKHILPMTLHDTYNFIKNESVAPELIESILKQIPMLNGLMNQINVKETYNNLLDIFEMVKSTTMSPSSASDKSSLSLFQRIIAPFIQDYYLQFLQFNAQKKWNGLKTPFFMIFKNAFLKEFKSRIIDSGLLPSYTFTNITWKRILIAGLKADKYIWSISGKPSLLSQSKWMKIYKEIQILKRKYHINISGEMRNKQRIFKSSWHNFDDPYSILQFVLKQSNNFHVHIFSNEDNVNKIKTITDNKAQELKCKFKITDSMNTNDYYNVVTLASTIDGTIIVTKQPKTFTPSSSNGYNLFYNVDIQHFETINVYPNHLIVGVNNKLYSMKFSPMTKDELKQKIVFEYVADKITNIWQPINTGKTIEECRF